MSGIAVTRLLAGLAVLCLFAMGVLWSSGVKAQQPTAKCGPRADLVKMLGEKYHEAPIAIGMVSDQLLMETFGSPAGTWTMFFTNTAGLSCLVAEGDNWNFDTTAFDNAKKGEDM